MATLVLRLLVSLCFLQCQCWAVTVNQEKKLLIVYLGDQVDIPCNQDDASYYNMFWYQQKVGEGMKLMVWSTGTDEFKMEEAYKNWNLTRKTIHTSQLTHKSAAKEDQAVYFCAASNRDSGNVQYFGEGTILFVLETGKAIKYPKVKIYLPNKQEYKEHKLISLVCVATGFYPEHVRLEWFVNDIPWKSIYENVPQESDDKETFYTSKRLSLTRLEYFNPDNTFKCVAGFIGDDPKNKTSDEVKGEADCSISKEEYGMYIYQGKISYIMVLCKSAMYGIIVVFIIWRRKAIGTSS